MAEAEPAEKNELEAFAKQIRMVIEDNRKFLDRIMDDDFEPEPDLDSSDDPLPES